MLPDPVPVICTTPSVDPQPVGLVIVPKAITGIGLIITFCVAVADVHPFADTYKLYVPAFVAVVFDIEGLCMAEVNPFGPLQV